MAGDIAPRCAFLDFVAVRPSRHGRIAISSSARREVLVNLGHSRDPALFQKRLLLIMSDAAARGIIVSERRVAPLRERVPGL
jgi:hypothetical protein